MPTPKRKVSKSRRDMRSANKGLKAQPVNTCAHCQEAIGSHQVCQECGFYKGRKVLVTKTDRAQVRATSRETMAARSRAQEAISEPTSSDSQDSQ